MEHFTIDGSLFLAFANYRGDIRKLKTSSMIYKMDKSTKKFILYQSLQTRGAYGLEYFSIAGKHFLAVANHYDGTHLLDSVIYQWNGKLFVVFQGISTKGGSHFAFFMINSEEYLAVANYYDGRTQSTKSVIYKWSSGKFNKFQEIATEGAIGCTAFVINNDTFIAFANHYNPQQKYSVQSAVFKWSGGHFVKQQSLQTYGAFDVKSFNINGHTFLVFANHHSGSSHGLANHYDSSQKYNTHSVVYQASGARFIKYQEIPTYGAFGITSFEYKGHTYLAVANHYSPKYNINSALYKWV